MLRKLLFLFISIALVTSYSFTLVSQFDTVQQIKTVELEKKSYGGTRSATATVIHAFTDDYIVTISIENYEGMATAEVVGTGGTAQQSAQITGSGQLVLDISSFNAGVYTLRIILGNTVYEGFFEK